MKKIFTKGFFKSVALFCALTLSGTIHDIMRTGGF